MVFKPSAIPLLICVLVSLGIGSSLVPRLLPVDGLLQTINRYSCRNHFRSISMQKIMPNYKSCSTSSSLSSSWVEQESYYEDNQWNTIEEMSQAEYNEYAREQWRSPQQQYQQRRGRTFGEIVSYDTGGNSFAQPIQQPELSVGRGYSQSGYSEIEAHEEERKFFESDANVSGQIFNKLPAGPPLRNEKVAWEEEPRDHEQQLQRTNVADSDINSQSMGQGSQGEWCQQQQVGYSMGKSNNDNEKISLQAYGDGFRTDGARKSGYPRTTGGRSGGGGGTYRRGLRKPKHETLSPELTVGRTRNNGYKTTNSRNSSSKFNHLPQDNESTLFGGGGVLQHYGTGTDSFSQPIGPGEFTTGRTRSWSDGSSNPSSSLEKQGQNNSSYNQNSDQDRNWESSDEESHQVDYTQHQRQQQVYNGHGNCHNIGSLQGRWEE